MNRRDFIARTSAALGSAAVRPLPAATAASLASLASGIAQPSLRVNAARLNAHLAALAEFGKNPQGGVSRVAYSDADVSGRKYVMGLMHDAKLDVTVDAAGNIIGR